MAERLAHPRSRRRAPARPSAGRLERGLAQLAAAERRSAQQHAQAASRAVQEERLRRLEQDLAELRGRLNNVIYVAVGAVITQVLLRLFG